MATWEKAFDTFQWENRSQSTNTPLDATHLNKVNDALDVIDDRVIELQGADADMEEEIAGKQDALTFDDVPTDGSNNPVKSNGIYDALNGKVDKNGTDRLMTAAEGTKLEGIAAGAQVNVLEGVVVDSVVQPISGKKAFIDLSGKADLSVIAYTFNSEMGYFKGAYVTYNGKLYEFIQEHTGAWNPSHVREIRASGQYVRTGNGGYNNGDRATCEGYMTKASGNYSHAEGRETQAVGECTHAEGRETIANSIYQHVEGKYNIADNESKYIHIIGNGIDDNNRSNAMTLDWDGNLEVSGDVEDGNGEKISDKADKVTNATSGHLAGLDSNGNLTDSGVSPTELVLNKIYSFHIDSSESDPDACVTYLDDAVGMTPAYMDFANGRFNYGSWADAFFMPRPCMLKFDGTVDYYLDPNDYSKKADGSPSDVADDTYGGNAMMEWGKNGRKIWYKVIPDASDATSGTIKIANYQVDSTYHAWSFINMQGNLVDHFYTPIYNGTIVDGKLRSISGKDYTAYCKSKDASEEITAAEANDPSTDKLWYTEVFSDIQLINSLLVLMGKSLDTQTVFGEGRTGYSWSESLLATTGGMDNKGLFYGESTSQGLGVKVFGMEHWWGNQWRRYAGHINDSGTIKVKLTYGQQDGSTVDGYNTTASGYLTVSGCTPAGTNGGYADKAKIDAVGGILPYNASGSDQHYYSDGLWFNNGQRDYALRGGPLAHGRRCGAFYLDLGSAPSARNGGIGAALSCKPLANKNEGKLDKSDVATIEGDTASRPYSVNDFMLRSDGLYKVTAPIASGASITASNTTKTTIGAVLTALLNA